MTPPKLTVDSAGRVHGANVTWNSPWPCENGSPGGMSVPHGVMGLLVHTMAGNLEGTVSWFNQSASQASAHFGVDQAGSIHQFGPVNGWKAWHAADGNPNWYGCEFADNGQPANPLTEAQISAAAQLLELLSRVGNFPLQLSDSTSTEGYGWHGMGGSAFGGHFDCPGDTRKAQRPQILAMATAIRGGVTPPAPHTPPTPAPVPQEGWTAAMISNLPVVQQGATGATVRTVQGLCAARGHAVTVDGSFGPGTAAAVKAVQSAGGLTADAVVGQQTWSYLVTGSKS